MSILILIIKHTKYIFNHPIIIGIVHENRYFSFSREHKDNTDTDDWWGNQSNATYTDGARIRISQSPSCRLVVAVFGTAVATITVNVSFTSPLLTRGFSSRVGCSSPPAFGLPDHRGRALWERFVSDVWWEICKARKVWQLFLRTSWSILVIIKIVRKQRYLTL